MPSLPGRGRPGSTRRSMVEAPAHHRNQKRPRTSSNAVPEPLSRLSVLADRFHQSIPRGFPGHNWFLRSSRFRGKRPSQDGRIARENRRRRRRASIRRLSCRRTFPPGNTQACNPNAARSRTTIARGLRPLTSIAAAARKAGCRVRARAVARPEVLVWKRLPPGHLDPRRPGSEAIGKPGHARFARGRSLRGARGPASIFRPLGPGLESGVMVFDHLLAQIFLLLVLDRLRDRFGHEVGGSERRHAGATGSAAVADASASRLPRPAHLDQPLLDAQVAGDWEPGAARTHAAHWRSRARRPARFDSHVGLVLVSGPLGDRVGMRNN